MMLISSLLLFSSFCGIQAELDYDGKLQVFLEHALDDSNEPTYSSRGDIVVKSLHSGASYVDQKPLVKHEAESLQSLAKAGKMYRLKATVKGSDGRQSVFHTFAPACALVESELSDAIFINLDHVGNVVALTLTTENTCSFSGTLPTDLSAFKTSVYVRHLEMGPVPDTASYIQRLEREREAKERGETKDNRSFLAKYWMYIVPVVIFVLISGASNPEGGGAGQ